MDLAFTDDHERFRSELRQWLAREVERPFSREIVGEQPERNGEQPRTEEGYDLRREQLGKGLMTQNLQQPALPSLDVAL